jgi:hypothetical protein
VSQLLKVVVELKLVRIDLLVEVEIPLCWVSLFSWDVQSPSKMHCGFVLDVGLVRRKGYFWKRRMQGGKEIWKENQHVQVE